MQTVVLQRCDDQLESAPTTASASSTVDVSPSLVLDRGDAREQLINELMDSIVERYGEAFDQLGQEPDF